MNEIMWSGFDLMMAFALGLNLAVALWSHKQGQENRMLVAIGLGVFALWTLVLQVLAQ